jgi:hypothetical protein
MRLSRLVFLGSTFLVGCAGVQQGPPVEDLAAVAVPKVVDDAKKAAAPDAAPAHPAPPPGVRPGFKVWIPRLVTLNGDVHEGHYVDVSDKAPQKELAKPDYEIPKAPKQIYRHPTRPAAGTGPTPGSTPPRQSPQPQQAPWPHQPAPQGSMTYDPLRP